MVGRGRPVGYELRGCLHDRWVRFHSLPGSKRYAGNDDEYAGLMYRYLTVLAELLSRDSAGEACEHVIVTASWSDGPRPSPCEAELAGVLPAAAYWTSVLTGNSEPGAKTWTHPWVSAAVLSSGAPHHAFVARGEYTRGIRCLAGNRKWPRSCSCSEGLQRSGR